MHFFVGENNRNTDGDDFIYYEILFSSKIEVRGNCLCKFVRNEKSRSGYSDMDT